LKLGVFTPLFYDRSLEETLDHVKESGLDAVEIGCGAYPGNKHCNPDLLLEDESARRAFQQAVVSRGLMISALSAHGNPLHPRKEVARPFHEVLEKTIRLAELLEVPVVNCFSGCPGDSENAQNPNWPVVAWPDDFREILEWQWKEKIIPYWKEMGRFAEEHHVRLAFEMHGGFSVHNPPTLLRLREAVGEVIGANFDPSHLFWQGIDPILAVRHLGPAIVHVHAKDTMMDPVSARIVGVLDTTPYDQVMRRSWIFRSVGYGHDNKFWKDFVAALRTVGYDYVLSIEHEDILFSSEEGFQKAVATLKEAIAVGPLPKVWWA